MRRLHRPASFSNSVLIIFIDSRNTFKFSNFKQLEALSDQKYFYGKKLANFERNSFNKLSIKNSRHSDDAMHNIY
jgi:hypothetical protein